MRVLSRRLVSSIALSAAAFGCALASPAAAQTAEGDQAEDAERGVGVIVVTAQKREQDQRDVPLSISTLSSDALAADALFKPSSRKIGASTSKSTIATTYGFSCREKTAVRAPSLSRFLRKSSRTPAPIPAPR